MSIIWYFLAALKTLNRNGISLCSWIWNSEYPWYGYLAHSAIYLVPIIYSSFASCFSQFNLPAMHRPLHLPLLLYSSGQHIIFSLSQSMFSRIQVANSSSDITLMRSALVSGTRLGQLGVSVIRCSMHWLPCLAMQVVSPLAPHLILLPRFLSAYLRRSWGSN